MSLATRTKRPDLVDWLHSLDSYTNAEFGGARTLAALRGTCVACDSTVAGPDVGGLCPRCVEKRRPDHSEIVLFRPLRRPLADRA